MRTTYVAKWMFTRLWSVLGKQFDATDRIALADSFDTQGPSFLIEPQQHLEFTNIVDNHVDCTARGSPPPKIEWLMLDNSPVPTIPRVSTLHTHLFRSFCPSPGIPWHCLWTWLNSHFRFYTLCMSDAHCTQRQPENSSRRAGKFRMWSHGNFHPSTSINCAWAGRCQWWHTHTSHGSARTQRIIFNYVWYYFSQPCATSMAAQHVPSTYSQRSLMCHPAWIKCCALCCVLWLCACGHPVGWMNADSCEIVCVTRYTYSFVSV